MLLDTLLIYFPICHLFFLSAFFGLLLLIIYSCFFFLLSSYKGNMSFLQLESVARASGEHLVAHLTPESCLAVRAINGIASNKDLVARVDEYIQQLVSGRVSCLLFCFIVNISPS